MFLARNAVGQECLRHLPGSILWGAPPAMSWARARVVPGIALMVHVMTAGHTSAKPIKKPQRTGFIIHRSWRVQGLARKGRITDLALLGVEGRVPRVSRVYSLLANFKRKNKFKKNITQCMGRKKREHSSGQFSRLSKVFKKGAS